MEKKERQQLIEKLEKEGFSSTTDIIGTYCKGNPLFYKLIGENKYLVFNHYNSKKKRNIDGFDCWSAAYLDQKDIGIKKTEPLKEIRLSFNFDRDFYLIKDLLKGAF